MLEKKLAIFAVLAMAGLMTVVSLVSADVLVTKDGNRLETDGPWEVKRNLVIFTTVEGVLSSIRLSEIDLEASELATNPPEVETEEDEAEEDKPVLVFTNVEIPTAEEAAVARGEGDAALNEEQEDEPEDPCLPNVTLGSPVISGKKVIFNGTAIAPRGCPGIGGIHWIWGDGTESDGWFPVKHNYDQPGEYYLEIIARNQKGQTVTKEVVVKIPAQE